MRRISSPLVTAALALVAGCSDGPGPGIAPPPSKSASPTPEVDTKGADIPRTKSGKPKVKVGDGLSVKPAG